MAPTIHPVVVAAVAGAGAVSSAVDMQVRRVPNPLTLGIASVGMTLAAVHATPVGITGAVAGLGVGLALMLPGHIIGATGAGDVKLFAALGTFLGPARIGMAFLYMALVGLYACVAGRDAVDQILGFLMFENGIFAFGLLATYGLPGLVEAGVFLDVLVVVLVIEGLVIQIRREHASLDVDRLRELRG